MVMVLEILSFENNSRNALLQEEINIGNRNYTQILEQPSGSTRLILCSSRCQHRVH